MMTQAPKKCPPLLTVVFRDDGPLVHCEDSPSFRSVTIELTDAQRIALSRHTVGHWSGADQYEAISRCFIEPEIKA